MKTQTKWKGRSDTRGGVALHIQKDLAAQTDPVIEYSNNITLGDIRETKGFECCHI